MSGQQEVVVYHNEGEFLAETDQRQFLSSGLHYVFAALIFTVYGIQVCPLLEDLNPLHLAAPVVIAWFFRPLLFGPFIQGQDDQQVSKQFKLDFGLFLAAALGLILVNTLLFNAPWESNGKVLIGLSILGLFISLDMALQRERMQSQDLIRQNKELDLSKRFLSFSKKFSFMAILVVFSIATVLFLVVNKDLEWLLNEGRMYAPEHARYSILAEIAFIMLVLLGYSIKVISSYVQNLNMYLSHQNGVLNEVMKGNLSVKVPVTSPDEFGRMAKGTNTMIESLRKNQAELQQTRDVSILALASLAETRDNETGAHILRTQRYVKALALNLQVHPDFKGELSDAAIDLLFKSAPLHDVGKVGIPDSILLKPGKLTDEEFTIMKQHAQLGADALLVAESQLGSNSFLRLAREIAACHHEKWNGSGYPQGLLGDDIPLSARLMALADVYDALISKRVYKPAFSHDKAKAIILEGEGTHFDPRVVQAFLECEDEFKQIAVAFKDSEQHETEEPG